MSRNIEEFNNGVVLILAELYENFPNRVRLNTNDFPEVTYSDKDPITDEKVWNYLNTIKIYQNTAYFLLEEGYITGIVPDGFTFIDNCTLTSKGLAVLQKMPKSLKAGNYSIGDFFIEIVKDSFKSATKESVKYAVQSLFN